MCVKHLCSHSHGHFQLCFCSGTWRIHGEQLHRLEVHFGQACKPLEDPGNLVCSSLQCSIINWMTPKWCYFGLRLASEKFCPVFIGEVQLKSGGCSLPSEHWNLCYLKGPIKRSLYSYFWQWLASPISSGCKPVCAPATVCFRAGESEPLILSAVAPSVN